MLCRLKICGGKQIQDKTTKSKNSAAGEIGLFCASRIFRRHFLVNKTGYFFIHSLPKACPPPPQE
ncbi:hypothetical protein, partial [Neisseria polysaccharea]|uniref:hypothetical protein n=1 Tax=Neisseria polysaccharea TaxID=489 RepID=UPI0027E07756